ncbi:MAG: hypothetical protein JNG82_03655 [Opitutaceae bacterium]|nr:hypothetical protein [Opitutaceae bacterium]
MHTRSRPVQLNLPLPAADYRVFVLATRILRRVMGRKAPTTLVLILRNLTERNANGVADDYLDWVGWPQGRLPAAPVTRRRSCGRRNGRTSDTRLNVPVLRSGDSLDPTRN